METKVYEKPLFIEELVFWVKPELVEQYLELDREIFSLPLTQANGYLGGEIWVSADKPGEVSSFYFWAREEDYHAIDQAWLDGQKAKMDEAMGAGNLRFVRAGHSIERRFKAREYRL